MARCLVFDAHPFFWSQNVFFFLGGGRSASCSRNYWQQMLRWDSCRSARSTELIHQEKVTQSGVLSAEKNVFLCSPFSAGNFLTDAVTMYRGCCELSPKMVPTPKTDHVLARAHDATLKMAITFARKKEDSYIHAMWQPRRHQKLPNVRWRSSKWCGEAPKGNFYPKRIVWAQYKNFDSQQETKQTHMTNTIRRRGPCFVATSNEFKVYGAPLYTPTNERIIQHHSVQVHWKFAPFQKWSGNSPEPPIVVLFQSKGVWVSEQCCDFSNSGVQESSGKQSLVRHSS